MNQKKAKQIRQFVRKVFEGDYKSDQTLYHTYSPPHYEHKIGELPRKVRKGIPLRLGEKCFRRYYKDAKKLYKRGRG